MIAALGLLASCGGGGGGSGGAPAPTPSPSPPPAPQKTLFVATQPVGSVQATTFATQPIVHVRSNGATDTADSSTVVTAALVAGTGSAGAQLTGTTTATAAAGIATFTNLGISLAGTNYQLRFTATGVTEATSSGFAVTAPPAAATVTFNIDSSQDVHPISRFIYGMNGWDPTQRPKNLTLSRSGGNRMTAYNWETNDSNAGADYHNQNDTFLGGGTEPNGAVRPGLEAARAAGAGMIVTLPLIGYVSADHQGNLDVAGTVSNPAPNYLSTRFHQSLPRKGSAFAATPGHHRRLRLPGRVRPLPRRQVPGRLRSDQQPHLDQPRQRARPLAIHARTSARRHQSRHPGGADRDLCRDDPANHRLRRRRQGRESRRAHLRPGELRLAGHDPLPGCGATPPIATSSSSTWRR